VNVRIPLWLLRFGSNATIDFSEADGDVLQISGLAVEFTFGGRSPHH
jgi:hypothetical protein